MTASIPTVPPLAPVCLSRTSSTMNLFLFIPILGCLWVTNPPFLTIPVSPLFLLLPHTLSLPNHTQLGLTIVPGFTTRTLVGILAPAIGTLMTIPQNVDMTRTALFPPLTLRQFTLNKPTTTSSQGRGVKVTLMQSTCPQSPDEYFTPL